MNHWLDCIQIWYGYSLGISDDLINFWNESITNKRLPQPLKKIDMVVVGVILTNEFCLFFTDMTYVPGQFIPYFFWHQAISGHFPRWPPKKLVGTITYEPLVGLRSNLVWFFSLGISDDLINFWDEFIKNSKLKKKNGRLKSLWAR